MVWLFLERGLFFKGFFTLFRLFFYGKLATTFIIGFLMGERINKFLASCGQGSRRDVEHLVKAGKVTVNGCVISNLALKVEKEDVVEINGKIVKPRQDTRVIVLNKPAGYLVSHRDKYHENTVFSLLPEEFANFKYAGRLDLKSRGLMVFTLDGALVNRLTHPSGNLEKEYLVTLERLPDAFMLEEIVAGVESDGEILHVKKVNITNADKKQVTIILGEGKKRHIRRIFAYFGIRVIDLLRTRIGKLSLDTLKLAEGQYCEIKKEDIYSI